MVLSINELEDEPNEFLSELLAADLAVAGIGLLQAIR
jgi:hypothetical protein